MTDEQLPTLHLVFSAAGFSALSPLLATTVEDGPQPSVVLLQDACYLLHDTQVLLPPTCYLLQEDAQLRAVALEARPDVQLIDRQALVELCCEHLPLVSWA